MGKAGSGGGDGKDGCKVCIVYMKERKRETGREGVGEGASRGHIDL